MAARLTLTQDQRTRDAIKTSQLANRLESFALSEKDPQTFKPVKMTRDQVTAALGLLKKTLPDLTATTMSGPGGGPVQHDIASVDRPPSETREEWLARRQSELDRARSALGAAAGTTS